MVAHPTLCQEREGFLRAALVDGNSRFTRDSGASFPQRLKPNSFWSCYVRAEARTLRR